MGEMPLELKRVQLALNYWVNLKGQNDPTQNIMKPCWEKEREDIKSSGWIISQHFSLGYFLNLKWILNKKNREKGISFYPEKIKAYVEYNSYGSSQIQTDASKSLANKTSVPFIILQLNIKLQRNQWTIWGDDDNIVSSTVRGRCKSSHML